MARSGDHSAMVLSNGNTRKLAKEELDMVQKKKQEQLRRMLYNDGKVDKKVVVRRNHQNWRETKTATVSLKKSQTEDINLSFDSPPVLSMPVIVLTYIIAERLKKVGQQSAIHVINFSTAATDFQTFWIGSLIIRNEQKATSSFQTLKVSPQSNPALKTSDITNESLTSEMLPDCLPSWRRIWTCLSWKMARLSKYVNKPNLYGAAYIPKVRPDAPYRLT